MKRAYFSNRFVRFHNHATNAYLVLNEDSTIVELNQAASILLSDSDLMEKKLAVIIHPDDRKKFHINHKYLLHANRKKTWHVRIKQPKGDYTNLELGGVGIINDKQNFEVFITLKNQCQHEQREQPLKDINDRLQAKIINQDARLKKNRWQLRQRVNELLNTKQKLANKEAILGSIFNAAVEGIITIDQFGIIVSVNKSVTTLFGYKHEELLGANVSILMPFPHKAQHDDYIKKYIETNHAHIIGKIREIEGQHKNGSILTLDLSIAEFKIKQQRYFTGILRDVSERKRKEIIDKEHLAELAHVTRLGLMGEMASGIAHEVNQPLTAIAAYTQTCLKLLKSGSIDSIDLNSLLKKINKQSLLAGRIIHQVRTMVSSKEVQKTLIDINVLIHEVVDLCKSESEQAAIVIKCNLATSLPVLFVDVIQIEQVLLNLIRNGFEALSPVPKDEQRQIEIQTYLNDEHNIEVRIKDFGPGLNVTEQANIFKPFYTTKKTGMGMGLSISRSIIEAHHGTLRFNSKKGFGTTFYFILPINNKINDK